MSKFSLCQEISIEPLLRAGVEETVSKKITGCFKWLRNENYGWDGGGQYDLFRALEACKRTILRKGSFINHNPNTDMLMIYR